MALTKIDDRGLKTPIELLDDEELRLGNSDDLKIYHLASDNHSYIEQTSSVNALIIKANYPRIRSYTGNEQMILANINGQVELFYDNSKKFETLSAGAKVTGDLTVTNNILLTTDNTSLRIGAGEDLQMWHDNSNGYLAGYTGQLKFLINGNEKAIIAHPNSGVELYSDNVKRFETGSLGARFFGNLYASDNYKLLLGDSQDLEIYHDGTHSFVSDTGTGQLRLCGDTNVVIRKGPYSDVMLNCVADGAIELYYDASKKLETASTGVTVTGTIVADNTPGRNVIVNGAMQVAQRGTSFTNISNLGVIGSVDRIMMVGAGLDELAFAGKQTSDGPDGFKKCFEFDVTTAENALDANDLAYIRYKIEGQDLVSFYNANGTGKNFVISFYVKAYQAGTYQLNIYKPTGTRFISKTYTIASSATWQRIEIPITGDTNTSGINDNNAAGLNIAWMLVAGTDYTSAGVLPNWGGWPGNSGFAGGQAVNVASSTNNYFRITGIQLELGDKATNFEHKSFADDLLKCQRYYETSYPSGYSAGHNFNDVYPFNTSKPVAQNYIASDDTLTAVSYPFMVNKRASPTVTIYSAKDGASGNGFGYKGTGGTALNIALNVIQTREQQMMLGTSLGAVNQATEMYYHYTASSEL